MSSYLDEFERAVGEYRKIWAKFQDEGTEYYCEIPDKTMRDYFEQWAEYHPDKPYICMPEHTFTYGETNQLANKIAHGFLRIGLKKGDRLLTFMKNGFEFIMIGIACYKIGVVLVAENQRATSWEVSRFIKDCTPKAIACDSGSKSAVVEGCSYAGDDCSVEKIVYFDGMDGDPISFVEDIIDCRTFLRTEDSENPSIEVLPDDLQLLQYTGGTDGILKACCFTNKNMVASGIAVTNYFKPLIPLDQIDFMHNIPMFHAFGLGACLINPIIVGSRVVIPEVQQCLVDDLLDCIEKFKPTMWPIAPVIVDKLTKQPEYFDEYDLSSVKAVLSGSSPITADAQLSFESMANLKLIDAYGLSEALAVVSGNPIKNRKLGTVGIPFCNVDFLTVDETGEKVKGIGECGEIITRGPQVMQGYWNNPEKTAQVMRGGWLYTGDLGIIDEQGHLSIVGRKKDIIMVSGLNIYPLELEGILRESPLIADACVIGVPDKQRGEIPKAFIVLKGGSSMTEEEVKEFCRKKLARIKVPRLIEFIDSIPRTKVGKPDKNALRKREQEKRE